MQKRFLLGIICIVLVLVLAFVIVCLFSFAHNQDYIWVTGLSSNSDNRFEYTLKHKRIFMTGAVNKFNTSKPKGRFFQEIKNQYQIFEETENAIKLVFEGEIYTIEYLGKNYWDYQYQLYGEYLTCTLTAGEFPICFPFPTEKVSDNDSAPIPRVSLSFEITCDMAYLQKFYAYYPDVQIVNNCVYYKDYLLMVSGSIATISAKI